MSVKGELEAAKEDTKQAAKEANTVQEQLETANSELKQRISILEDHKVSRSRLIGVSSTCETKYDQLREGAEAPQGKDSTGAKVRRPSRKLDK